MSLSKAIAVGRLQERKGTDGLKNIKKASVAWWEGVEEKVIEKLCKGGIVSNHGLLFQRQ